MSIGLKDTDCDEELAIIAETPGAYLLEDELLHEIWMPKSAFDEDGIMHSWGEKLYLEKLENME